MKIKLAPLKLVSLLASLAVAPAAESEATWNPVPDKMMTTWGSEVTPDNTWREYPRPQFERSGWKNLNGLMTYDRKIAKTPASKLAELHQRLGPEIKR